jgi:hypothetical protein
MLVKVVLVKGVRGSILAEAAGLKATAKKFPLNL